MSAGDEKGWAVTLVTVEEQTIESGPNSAVVIICKSLCSNENIFFFFIFPRGAGLDRKHQRLIFKSSPVGRGKSREKSLVKNPP